MDSVLPFLLLTCVIVLVPYLVWSIPAVGRFVPLVVLHILLGVALGPTLLGSAAPEVAAWLLAPETVSHLAAVGWLAVTFFGFLTGLHFDLSDLRGRGRLFAWVSVSSVLLPLIAGVGVGLWLLEWFPFFAGEDATRWSFAFGFGIAIAVTALPVLAGILRELNLVGSQVGQLALGAAAVNDLFLWVLVGLLLLFSGTGGVPLTLLAGIAYILFLVVWLRPRLPRLLTRLCADGEHRERELVLVLTLCFGSAAVTEAAGLHYIVGGFVAGAILPKPVAAGILRSFEPFALLLLMPFFFVTTGLQVELNGAHGVVLLFLIATAVAMVGKLLSTAVPARLCGMSWRDAWRTGALMQCKGLMEVVVLTILLDVGIISVAFFTGLVLMAIATTVLTKPMVALFDRVGPVTPWSSEQRAARRQ